LEEQGDRKPTNYRNHFDQIHREIHQRDHPQIPICRLAPLLVQEHRVQLFIHPIAVKLDKALFDEHFPPGCIHIFGRNK
jgi:hypothetical protein